MAKQNKNRFRSLLGLFGIKPNRKTNSLDPAKKIQTSSGEVKLEPIKLPSDLQKALDYFQKDFTMVSDENTPDNRLNRYNELEFMIYNEGLMYTAAQIYSSETTNADEQNRIIGIKAKNRTRENNFYQWVADVGYTNNILKSIAWDLTVFGDAHVINSIDMNGGGIKEVLQISPKEVRDRLEFQAIKIQEAMNNNRSSYNSLQGRSETLKNLYNQLTELEYEDYSDAYRSYLFGFLVGDNVLPPWSVTHFRRFSSGSEFAPFGRPLFIGSVARYKSYKATELIVDSARMASFPTKVYEIQGGTDMGTAELQHKINQVRQMYQNITSESKAKDELTVGEAIFTIDGLVKYNQYESRIDLNQIGDLEAKRTDLILSTGIPQGYLFPDRGGFGNSGQSLLQQSKIVARRVYDNQTSVLEAITEQYRLHLFITEGEEAYNEDFELYMNYPIVEESSDRMRLKTDSVRLATDIISNLGQSLGLDRGEALPVDIVRDVFSKYSFLDMEEVSEWLDTYLQSKETIDEEIQNMERKLRVQENTNSSIEEKSDSLLKSYTDSLKFSKKFYSSIKEFVGLDKPTKKIKEKVDDRLTEQIIRREYFKSKRNLGLQESVIGGKHLYGSFSKPSPSLETSIKEARLYRDTKLKEDS